MTPPRDDRHRLPGPDIARGIAIAGTLATNIWIFSHPEGMLGYLNSPTTPGVDGWQATIERLLQQLANGKFLGLLTLLFGIGLAIQADIAARRGQRWPGSYLWRAALLLLDGVLNYVLIIEFDVLMGYAVTGAVVAYLLTTSPRTQRVWFFLTASVHVLLIGWITLGLLGGYASLGTGSSINPNPYQDGSFLDLVRLRLDNLALFRFEPVLIFAGSIALFLLGARLHRASVFAAERADLRRPMIIVGALAAVIDVTLGMSQPDLMPLTRWVIAPVVAVGLLALIAEITHRGGTSWLRSRLGEVGRVALSAYIAQNIVASVIFYGWGLGLNRMPPDWRLPVTVVSWFAIMALITWAAHLWLRRFNRGPVEWLWNRSYQWLSRDRRRTPIGHPG